MKSIHGLALLLVIVTLCVLSSATFAQQPAFVLAPAVAVEGEEFEVQQGWKVVQNGQGNYMVDIIGFSHISGERLLCAGAGNEQAVAKKDIQVPQQGDYRLWVRYEYPPHCECRFTAEVVQNGKTVAQQIMGKSDSPRYAFGQVAPVAQHDPSWGAEGIVEEAMDLKGLATGAATLFLKVAEQPQLPGKAAGRNIDLVYLTSDLQNAWVDHYRKRANLYPILEAFRDTRGPRYEVRFTNHGEKPAQFNAHHVYNRIPWGMREGPLASDVPPAATTDWIGLKLQDTAHFSLVRFQSNQQPFDLEIRPVGGPVERKASGDTQYGFYLPSYPGKGEKIVSPEEEIDAILKLLADTPITGRTPTQPWCYGGWLPMDVQTSTGKKYAELYKALGFRSFHGANHGNPLEVFKFLNLEPTPSWAVSGYRNPPTPDNITKAKAGLEKNGMAPWLKWYDYGDEIGFSEWLGTLIQYELAQAKAAGKPLTRQAWMSERWQAWLKQHRPHVPAAEYWLPAWGPFDAAQLRPESSAATAMANPRLYVDSVIFYEDTAIAFVASGAKQVRAALGENVLCGANYSCHPFYYPHTTMYVKWFRDGAAEMGRHSEYFWQITQAGPMINGYIAEHFRSGMRNNPRAVLRQYTMPHSPGNTEGNFLRSCYSHVAHGAKQLDFFGIGMNETFTENHIDHRDHRRYVALREITHAIGLVEDLLPNSQVVPSQAALLISESTERWDMAGIARDLAGHAHFGADFRQTRLNSHLERLGIWQALTFMGHSPDLLLEEDLQADILKPYRVLYVVGDSLPADTAQRLRPWVEAGGVLVATAGTGRFDSYRKPNHAMQELLGLSSREVRQETTFMRVRQELPFLAPLGMLNLKGQGADMPVLATDERITPVEGAEVLATVNNLPAAFRRPLGKGYVYYMAAQPGLAYLWSALQPPLVPDRGIHTHTIPTGFNAAAAQFIGLPLESLPANVVCSPSLIDARLIRAPKGYIIPLANYHAEPGQKVIVTLRFSDEVPQQVISARHGALKLELGSESGTYQVVLPKLEFGDILRLE